MHGSPYAATQEAYGQFLRFIDRVNQSERSDTNRKMRSVFFWCFLAPAILMAAILILINAGVMPRSARGYLDWILPVFPVLYSLYFLGSQVISGVPKAFRQGAMLNLDQALREGEWRATTCERMEKELHFDAGTWKRVILSFEIDLERIQTRSRYLTALAGATFFLIMQGVDSISDDGVTPPGNFSQFIGLALFLVLLYLSSQQTVHQLRRYLACGELLQASSSRQ